MSENEHLHLIVEQAEGDKNTVKVALDKIEEALDTIENNVTAKGRKLLAAYLANEASVIAESADNFWC